MELLCLPFPFKNLTFAPTFPTAVLNYFFEHNSERPPTDRQYASAAETVAVGPKGFFGEFL